MSEIEKMYKNAGCTNVWVQRYNDGYYDHEYHYNSYKEMINRMMKVNDWTLTEAQEVAKRECKKEHPPFTAEKQLLLLQRLARIESADYFQFFFYEIKQEWVFRLNMLTELSCESAYIYESRNKNFDECIAGLINIIWQDLTPEEKQQVKGILE